MHWFTHVSLQRGMFPTSKSRPQDPIGTSTAEGIGHAGKGRTVDPSRPPCLLLWPRQAAGQSLRLGRACHRLLSDFRYYVKKRVYTPPGVLLNRHCLSHFLVFRFVSFLTCSYLCDHSGSEARRLFVHTPSTHVPTSPAVCGMILPAVRFIQLPPSRVEGRAISSHPVLAGTAELVLCLPPQPDRIKHPSVMAVSAESRLLPCGPGLRLARCPGPARALAPDHVSVTQFNSPPKSKSPRAPQPGGGYSHCAAFTRRNTIQP